ncbi:A24 family peptidase [Streptomyces sp. ACA25]|uniref:prepilin peptidase n=1 Tax=Streptomyces sp. ACA25 TaxID=3022596 RepID=UPI002307B4AD|nr:A24 family peptidase [Streptomyces sp. ACA25]MDB1086936.1 A24 family peptidase [Streptomyces sp. ACA25]
MHQFLIVLAAGYGAVTGPLLARPGYRLSVEPGQPWRSVCPHGHAVPRGPRGWLGTTGCASSVGCPQAAAHGPRKIPLALVTGGCCAAVAAAAGIRPELMVWLLLIPGMVLLGVVDRAVQRLPDVLTLPLGVLAAGGLGLASLLPEAGGSWSGALLGGAGLGVGYFLLFLIHPRGMGFGDVKLAIPVGTVLGWYGWDAVFLGTFAGFLLAAGYGLLLVVARRASRRTEIPLGPFMLLGALAAVLLSGLAG